MMLQTSVPMDSGTIPLATELEWTKLKWCFTIKSNYIACHTIQQLQSWPFIPENWNLYLHKCLWMNVHSSFISNNPKLEITQCPSTDKWLNEVGYIHTMEKHSAIKRNEPLKHNSLCGSLGNYAEWKSKSHKVTNCTVPFMLQYSQFQDHSHHISSWPQ